MLAAALCVAAAASLGAPPAAPSAASKTYDWKDVVLENNSVMLIGPFSVYVTVSNPPGGTTVLYTAKIKKGDVVCETAQVSSLLESDVKVVREGCGGGNAAFTFKLYGEASAAEGPTKIKFDILDAIYSPETKLDLSTSANRTLSTNETQLVVDVPISVTNVGWITPTEAHMAVGYGRVEGNESAHMSLVTTIPPVADPTNFTLQPPMPGLSRNYTYQFSLDAGGRAYAKFTLTFTLTYPADFEKDEQHSTATHEVWRYSPGREVTKTLTFDFVVGARYKNVGQPSMQLRLNHSQLVAQPGSSLSFTLNIENRGTGDAYNVSIYLGVEPEVPRIVLTSPDVPGLTGEPFTGMMSRPLLIRKFPKNAYSPPIKFNVVFPEDVYLSDTVFTVTILVEWQNALGKWFNQTLTRQIVSQEPTHPSISVSKRVSADRIGVNGTVAVFVLVTNTGDAPATDVTITDSFPEEFFELVQGSASASIRTLPPGGNATVSYRLRALKEGVATLPPAQVDYYDRDVPHTEFSNGGYVTVVMPRVSLEVIQLPPSPMLVRETADLRFVLTNQGTGTARDVSITVIIPRGVDVIDAQGDGLLPLTRTEDLGWNVSYRIESIEPGSSVACGITVSPLAQGRYLINVTNATFWSPDGAARFDVEGASALQANFTAIVPYSFRVFASVAFAGMVAAVGVGVYLAARGPSLPGFRKARPRLGPGG